MVLWLADHPQLGQRLLWLMEALPLFFSNVKGVSGGVRRFVTFPWNCSLDFEALERVERVRPPALRRAIPLPLTDVFWVLLYLPSELANQI